MRDFKKKVSKLIRGVWSYEVVSRLGVLKPRSMSLVLTYRCNSRCIMCNIWKRRPKKELGVIDWKKVVGDDVLSDMESLTITGGEPLLHTEAVKIIELFIEKLPKLEKIIINTNGFSTGAIVDKIVTILRLCNKKGVRLAVTVSVDGVGVVHDQIRGIKSGFEMTKKTIDSLRPLKETGGLDLSAACVLMKGNLESYWDIKSWFDVYKIPISFQLVGFHDSYIENVDSKREIDFTNSNKDLLLEVLDDLAASKSAYGLMSYYWKDMKNMYLGERRISPCIFLKDGIVIDSLGDVYYCLSSKSIGNFIKEGRSVGEIYFDSNNILKRKAMWDKECRRCNSGCDVYKAIAFSPEKYLWFKITGKIC
jgi:MoaA/NifB/PqqE/SkfB family radical SAM enzyme